MSVQGIAYGQSITQDSIYYTIEQDKRCLECLINKSKKDTIIIKLEKALDIDSVIIQKHELSIINLRTESKEKDSKISKFKRQRKPAFIIGILLGLASQLLF